MASMFAMTLRDIIMLVYIQRKLGINSTVIAKD